MFNAQSDDNDIIAGFHVSAPARQSYEFSETLFGNNGKTTIPNFHTARVFAQQMNQKRDLISSPELAVYAGQINAVALIHGITQYLFELYCQYHNPAMLQQADDWLSERLGKKEVDKALRQLVDEFPPMPVYKAQLHPDDYLKDKTHNKPNRELALEEVLMIWLSNVNPAFSRFFELFSDDNLESHTAYKKIIESLQEFCDYVATLPAVTPNSFPVGESIIHFLLAPVRAFPNSLEGQLAYILEHWSYLIGPYMFRLLRGLDLLREEQKPTFLGPGPSVVPTFADFEAERFTPDKDWMPNLVLLAKNAYVWLDQLSKKYERPITRLDQIPDEELDQLARWGFTGLWLIGLWERSRASQTIKQWMGNPEAIASAYSLFDYQIAADLGGEAACNDLKHRAWRRGIRLASDMVPNHVGIDGMWVMEHPDWFISLPYPPFPGYSYTSGNLSWDSRVTIQIEDHYFTKSDAAVTFKRTDNWTGDTRYIYHGNDGTTMPWNDTAQLNYLNPEVREAMIQTILHVARQFPIIRFDAAMTLVKRHFHRLWFPEPGSGGAIPSRAEHGITRAQLDALMPEEFWREVVDRAAIEAPDTLLLAEAFWLMEGYFVRTLGMHRVYNSAFMNMLRDEDNLKYRMVIKNTLEFDPEVLKRYVNFMNNPDERTAVDQFGKEGKYFGVCILMVTMPGLPMFGHGQIEGFNEKYGMEYKKAYWDETPDSALLERHEREIFPLMRRRYLFAGVENFLMYDFYSPDGTVNENVFAYSNRYGEDRGLILYNNVFGQAKGWIRTSVGFSVRTGHGDERTIIQKSVGDGLGLSGDHNQFCIFRDYHTGLEYIRNSKQVCEQGLYVELGAYEYHIFLDFRIVAGNYYYHQLAAYLNGAGVPSIDEALRELYFQPIRDPFKMLVNSKMFTRLLDARLLEKKDQLDAELLDEVEQNIIILLDSIKKFNQEPTRSKNGASQSATIAKKLRSELEAVLQLLTPEHLQLLSSAYGKKTAQKLETELTESLTLWGGLLGWVFVHNLGQIAGKEDAAQRSRTWIDEWLLGKVIMTTLKELDIDHQSAEQTVMMIKAMTSHQRLFEGKADERPDKILTALAQDSEVQSILGVNRYQDILWFNKEAFDRLLNWLLLLPSVTAVLLSPDQGTKILTARCQTVDVLRKAADGSGYQLKKLLNTVTDVNKPKSKTSTSKSATTKTAAKPKRAKKTEVSE